jgi:hypothetical protein
MSTGRLGAGDTAIQPTILNAKADLLTATAADTPARLAVGADGTVLTAASGEATGLQWAAPAAGGESSSRSQTSSTRTNSRRLKGPWIGRKLDGYRKNRYYTSTASSLV